MITIAPFHPVMVIDLSRRVSINNPERRYPAGERIQRDGSWCVYEFAVQLDAIQFWDRFDGRWLRGEEFIYPDRPKGLPKLCEPADMDRFRRRPLGR
jgi:hypothetical protein